MFNTRRGNAKVEGIYREELYKYDINIDEKVIEELKQRTDRSKGNHFAFGRVKL